MQASNKPRLFGLLFTDRARKFLSPIVILVIWETVARFGLVAPYLLPSPSIIVLTLFSLLVSGELMPHLTASLGRALSGFAIGSTLGIWFGMLIGWSKIVEDITDIPIQAFRAVPISALVPLIIVWLGLGETSKIFIVAMPPFFLCLINTVAGVRSVDMIMVKAARSLGAKDRQILKEVVIPSAAPMIFAGLRLGIVVSLVLLIIAEMVAAERGLGYFILEAQRFWLTDKMFAGIVTMSILGFSFDRIVLVIEGHVLKWHRGKTMRVN